MLALGDSLMEISEELFGFCVGWGNLSIAWACAKLICLKR
jgi:hypothetical protein